MLGGQPESFGGASRPLRRPQTHLGPSRNLLRTLIPLIHVEILRATPEGYSSKTRPGLTQGRSARLAPAHAGAKSEREACERRRDGNATLLCPECNRAFA